MSNWFKKYFYEAQPGQQPQLSENKIESAGNILGTAGAGLYGLYSLVKYLYNKHNQPKPVKNNVPVHSPVKLNPNNPAVPYPNELQRMNQVRKF